MCKVYYAQNVKEITSRDYADKFFRTDQPIVDRAKQLELERQIKVAEMELSELKRKVGV
jgi:RecA-family ATPase